MAKRTRNFIRIVGDCGHPWYVVPDEVDDSDRVKPLKCPFCECEGAPLAELMDEMKQLRRQERKNRFLESRRKKRKSKS